FKLQEVSDTVDLTTPFRFTYKTTGVGSYTASFDGENYKNCRRLEDGSLLVIFDDHRLLTGRLCVKRYYYLTDSDFADGLFDLVGEYQLDVHLEAAASASRENIVIHLNSSGEQYHPEEEDSDSSVGSISFEIKDDGCLYVTQAEDSTVEFNINDDGELLATL
ncbi:MAG: hypothetical protein SNH64_07610, partial [Rikenellaceae bacterium]